MENPYRRADLTDKDSQGNTVLHSLVVIADNTTDNTDMTAKMYDEILIQHNKLQDKRIPLEAIENNQGLTPLKLAAKLGKIGVILFCLCVFSDFNSISNVRRSHLSCNTSSWSLFFSFLISPRPAVQAHTAPGVHWYCDEATVQEVYRMGLWTCSLFTLWHKLHRHQPREFCVRDSHLWEWNSS